MEKTTETVDRKVVEKAQAWLTGKYDEATKEQIRYILEHDPNGLTDAFYKDLEFGTGGLRGIMGAGTNRVNIYTIAMTTQGLANYLKKSFEGEEIKVAIAHDSRNNSRKFAEKTARVFSGNGIRVYLFESLRPTPELSFAIRHFNCHSGVVITASHNPKEYNGYKVYWQDGAQLVPPHDRNVMEEVRRISEIDQVKFDDQGRLISAIGEEIDSIYLEKVRSLSFTRYFEKGGNDLKVVFTPLHGTGVKLIPQALEQYGFNNVTTIKEQEAPDGDFPTVSSPNPEEPEALKLALNKAKEIDGDIVLGTDPDADRVGIAVKNDQGDHVLLNGNQTGVVLIWYILEQWKKNNLLKGKEFIAKTIVTTPLIEKIASHYNVDCYNTLTGFKYIAELIRNLEHEKQFIAGGEESYGYLAGDFVRDKDAVISAALLCEIAAWAKENGSRFYDALINIYLKFGFYKEKLLSFKKEGIKGADAIQQMMDKLRKNPPGSLAGSPVITIKDFGNKKVTDMHTGKKSDTGLPVSNVLQLLLEDGSLITARPSGTEPKIKFYFSVRGKLTDKNALREEDEKAEKKIDQIIRELAIGD